jgi:RND family efflux transporter MFP subunit
MTPPVALRRALPLVLVLLAAGCGKPAAPDSPPAAAARPVRVAPAVVEVLGEGVHAVGVLAPKDEARLSFKVGGIIDSIRVEEGARVRAGQVLAELKQAEVAAGLAQAREASAKATRDLERARALHEDGVATRQQFEDAGTAAAIAAASLQAVEFNARHARILAASDGVVLRKLADAGETVAAGQPVLLVGGTTRGWIVRLGLADRDVVRVRVGDGATLTFDAWPGRTFQGRIQNVAASADPATGTYTVEIGVAPEGSAFVQGLVAKVALSPAAGTATTVVPVQALVEANGDRANVYVFDPATKRVRRVSVRVGRLAGTDVEVLDGLEAGALVVIDGASYLENGETVRIATTADAPSRPRT